MLMIQVGSGLTLFEIINNSSLRKFSVGKKNTTATINLIGAGSVYSTDRLMVHVFPFTTYKS
jgi:hypothetical protein